MLDSSPYLYYLNFRFPTIFLRYAVSNDVFENSYTLGDYVVRKSSCVSPQ